MLFGYCSSLTSITIPDAVTIIWDNAFAYCSGLTEITCSATEPPYLGYSGQEAFDNSHYREVTVFVPKEVMNTYKNARYWNQFWNIVGKNLTSVGRIEAESTEEDATSTVYDLRGVKVAASPEGLPQGTYIVRQGGKSKKISVK
ncbi:MAG: leucine-rich repeat protein [Prevotellaceae bacterium]|nr:leucine-rich repeat protein [Prevotellaceae bacterium]